MTPARAQHALGLGVVFCACVLAGCFGRISEREGERLRRERADLQRRLELAEARAGELEAKLAESERARTGALPADVLAALPRCAGVEIEAISGLHRRRDDDAIEHASIIFYVRPYDAQRRFLQVAASMTCDATFVGPDGVPTPLARVELSPEAVRGAFRATPLGTHYTIESPLEGAPSPGTILLRVELLDHLSGIAHRADRTITIR